MKNFISNFDDRRFLVLFNDNVGLPNPPGVTVVGGWEDKPGMLKRPLDRVLPERPGPVLRRPGRADLQGQDRLSGQRAGDGRGCHHRQFENPSQAPPPPSISRVAGQFGNALALNGSSNAEYVALPAGITAQLTDFTIASWVNRGSADTWVRVFDFGQGTGTYMFLTPAAGVDRNATAVFDHRRRVGRRAAAHRQLGAADGRVGRHLAVTLSGTTGTLYVNGQVAATNTGMTLNPASLGNAANLWIGRSEFSDPFLNGAVDEFQIFDLGAEPGRGCLTARLGRRNDRRR